MPISRVQQGTITESEFVKFGVLGSNGELEFSRPASDDDQRDADVHRRSDFDLGLGFQVKSAMILEQHSGTDRLHIRFKVLKERLITHPFFFYFFAFLDLRIMGIADPAFIIPSTEVHQHAIPHLIGDTWHFDFKASLGPKAYGRWVPHRVNTLEIGKRILAIIADLERDRTQGLSPSSLVSQGLGGGLNVIWARRASGIIIPRSMEQPHAA
jgi:hypothetical protein